MLQLCAAIFCTLLLIIKMVQHLIVSPIFNVVYTITEVLFLLLYLFSWLHLFKVFYAIFGSLYHMRKKRFLKYTAPVAWFYEKFIHKEFYEKNYRKRLPFSTPLFQGVSNDVFQKVISGGSILFLYDDTADYSSSIVNFIRSTVNNNETIDYIATNRSPVDLCSEFLDDEIVSIANRLSIIDCFSAHYGFDDKVVKFAKQDYMKKGFVFYDALTFADVHTASNNSWYRFRQVCQAQENSYRIPHRTIYDTLSSLIRFSSEEQYFLFLGHVLSSEKSYGMVSVIIEPLSLKSELKNDLIHLADVVVEFDGSQFVVIK